MRFAVVASWLGIAAVCAGVTGADVTTSPHAAFAAAVPKVQQAPRHHVYSCPMHPQVRQEKPGRCPICGMDLADTGADTDTHDTRASGDGHAETAARATTMMSTPLPAPPPEPVTDNPPDTPVSGIANDSAERFGIRLAPVETRRIEPHLRTWGRAAFDSANEIQVTAPMDGWVRRLHVWKAGERVVAGTPLFDFYSPELEQRQRDYIDALDRRDQMLAAISDLRGQNGEVLASLARERKRQRDVLLRLGISPVSIERLERYRRPLEAVTVVASGSGIVTRINAREGAAVTPMEALYSILNDRAAQLDVVLTASQLNRLMSPVRVETSGGGIGLAAPLPIGQAVFDSGSNSFVVRVPLPSAVRFRQGQILDLVVIGAARQTLAVPREALVEGPDGAIVVVAAGGDRFRTQMVQPGIADDHWIGIEDGLKGGEQVVIDGQFLLDAEASPQDPPSSVTAE